MNNLNFRSDRFLELLEDMNSIDVSKTPKFVVIEALAKHPAAKYPDPVLFASQVKVEVNQEFIDDKKLMKTTIDTVVNVANKMWDALRERFSVTESVKLFNRLVQDITITYTY
jgi:hypothetical protein